jgi:leucyl aminopeptidase
MEFKINTIKVNEAVLVMLPVYVENKDLQDEKLTVIYKHFN